MKKIKPRFDLPFKRVATLENQILTEKINGIAAYMCPKCYQISYVNVYNAVITTDFLHYSGIYTRIKCDNCGYEYIGYDCLDPNIAPILSILNMKGYRTKYSCSGHWYKDGDGKYSRGYIYFSTVLLYKDILDKHPLPCGFYIDENDLLEGRLIIRENKWKKGKMKKTRIHTKVLMENLYDWADSLPYIADMAQYIISVRNLQGLNATKFK